jgi:hypothetical protein
METDLSTEIECARRLMNSEGTSADGMLRDVYVLNATIDDWRTFWRFIRSRPEPLAFTLDNQPQPMPATVDEVFDRASEINTSLMIDPNELKIACHFFLESELELDLDTRDYSNADFDRIAQLLRYLRDLARYLGREVTVTYEGHKRDPFLTFTPSGRIRAAISLRDD